MVNKFAGLVVFGLLFIIGGLIGYFVIAAKVRQELLDALIIDSKGHKNYLDWAKEDDADDTPYYYHMYFWNMTNPNEFLAGTQLANYEQIGPYVYREIENIVDTNLDAEFIDGGNSVVFNRTSTFIYQPSLSCQSDQKNGARCGSPDTDTIVNINPWYQVVGGKGGVLSLAAAVSMSSFAASTTAAATWGSTAVAAAGSYGAQTGAVTMTPTQSGAILSALLTDPAKIGSVLLAAQTAASNPTAAIVTNVIGGEVVNWQGWNAQTGLSSLATYLGTIGATKVAEWQGNTALTKAVGNTLFLVGRSPNEILFEPDFLMASARRTDSLLSNNTKYNYTVRTGKDDEDFLGMDYHTVYNGRTTDNMWQSPTVAGPRVATMTPFQGVAPDEIELYLSLARRSLTLEYDGVEKVKKIPTSKYKVDGAKAISASTFYAMPHTGMVNLAPIFGNANAKFHLSIPHWRHLIEPYRSAITGDMDTNPGYESYIWMEPVTGLGIKATKQLQYNFYVNFTAAGAIDGVTINNGAVANITDMYFPLFWANENVDINEESAKDLRRAVVDAATLRKLVLGVLVGVGIAMVLVGATLMVQLNNNSNNAAPEDGGEGEVNPLKENAAANSDAPAGESTEVTAIEENGSNAVESTSKDQQSSQQPADDDGIDAVEMAAVGPEATDA